MTTKFRNAPEVQEIAERLMVRFARAAKVAKELPLGGSGW